MPLAGLLFFVWPFLYAMMAAGEYSHNMMILTTAIVVAGALAGRKECV